MPGTGGLRYAKRSQSRLAKESKIDAFAKTLVKAKESHKSVEVNSTAEPKAKTEKKKKSQA